MPKDHGDIRRLSPTYEWFIIHHGLDREKLSAEKIREARRNYLGMISWLDEKVGLFLDELERLDLSRNTLVVLSSDHGEMLGEHGQWSKRIMLEWSARVPLILSQPGTLPPQLYDLAKDPEETVNLAGRREYANVESELRRRADRNWNGEETKRRVMASQQDRLVIQSMRTHGGAARWEHDAVMPGHFGGYTR